MTLGVIGLGLGAAGTGVAAYGSYKQGQAAGDAADQNAKLAVMQANDVQRVGNMDAGRARTEGSKVIAEQKVAFAASGVDPSVGAPVALAADSRAMSELDAQTIRNNAAREAWGLRRQARQMVSEGKQARSAGVLGAAGSILGGLGSAAQTAYGMRKG